MKIIMEHAISFEMEKDANNSDNEEWTLEVSSLRIYFVLRK
ncbi:5672_t:CDS:2 [Funneliformis mosseae]|uniref:5672_t:CDS:1 n=1 Tax=Funneliformis mosseae TaxID=27381 RepID=A0A9N9GBH2_FUNMO|nr:5672_t:CDS:2 [Funneliformis mosseae]